MRTVHPKVDPAEEATARVVRGPGEAFDVRPPDAVSIRDGQRCCAPEILTAHVGAHTSRIRVGPG